MTRCGCDTDYIMEAPPRAHRPKGEKHTTLRIQVRCSGCGQAWRATSRPAGDDPCGDEYITRWRRV